MSNNVQFLIQNKVPDTAKEVLKQAETICAANPNMDAFVILHTKTPDGESDMYRFIGSNTSFETKLAMAAQAQEMILRGAR
jgi:hypothetical protein